MGTINYKTSDYITIGYNDFCQQDFDDEYTEDDYYYQEEDDFLQVKYLLDREQFYYFHVTVEAGYYSGFSINIEHNFSYCYDSASDKRQAQKEITAIKKFLLLCVNDFNMCAVCPGWCTTYKDYKSTLQAIDAAIKEMRQTVASTPTYYKLCLAGEI